MELLTVRHPFNDLSPAPGARTAGKHSNTSQFYITFAAAPQCDGKHVVIGKVRGGSGGWLGRRLPLAGAVRGTVFAQPQDQGTSLQICAACATHHGLQVVEGMDVLRQIGAGDVEPEAACRCDGPARHVLPCSQSIALAQLKSS